MRRSVLLLLAALALGGCGGDGGERADYGTSAPTDGIEELANVLDLRSAFEADRGKTRVVMLLSPT